jgi:hypothetical protein
VIGFAVPGPAVAELAIGVMLVALAIKYTAARQAKSLEEHLARYPDSYRLGWAKVFRDYRGYWFTGGIVLIGWSMAQLFTGRCIGPFC